jgi:hypothetical protein
MHHIRDILLQFSQGKTFSILVYFPDSSPCSIESGNVKKLQWFNPANGGTITVEHDGNNSFTPPDGYEDGVLILK